MSKPTSAKPTSSEKHRSAEVRNGAAKLDRKYRHSLQPKSEIELPPSSLRHTQSHRYDLKGKKTKGPVTLSQIPSILEAENSEDEIGINVNMKNDKGKNATIVYENEKKSNRSSKKKNNDSNNKATFSFENAAFEGNMHSKRSSNVTIRTNSSRAPSIQSLEVVREQYCCCAKRTKCERTLLTTVTILTIIIIVLVTVVVILARNHDLDDIKLDYFKL